MSTLDAELLGAHAAQDASALIALYTDAAEQAPDETACGFFLTHAFVFALEAGDGRAEALRQALIAMGREPL